MRFVGPDGECVMVPQDILDQAIEAMVPNADPAELERVRQLLIDLDARRPSLLPRHGQPSGS